MTAASSSRALIVAGFVSYDYLLYPSPGSREQSDGAYAHLHGGTAESESQLVIRAGNADLVAQLLTAAAHSHYVLPPVLLPPGPSCLRHHASSFIELSDDYSVTTIRTIGRPPVWHSPPVDQAVAHPAATAIISGSGEAFTNVEPALDFLQRVRPRYIVHHMTRPLAKGALWDLVRDGPRTRDGVPDPDFLAVIVDAEDLRAEGIALSQSLSWEATAEDFVRNLGSNGRLDTLVTCPNLIVRFGTEGIIHHRGRDAGNPRLYYHPRMIERLDAKTQYPGVAPAFTAGFALGFADSKPDNHKGIRLGIQSSRRLEHAGFLPSAVDQAPDYAITQVMDNLQPDRSFASINIPSNRISSGDKWSIFDSMTGDANEVARQIVTLGPQKAIARCPVHCCGELWTVERSEQESMRAVIGAVHERLQAKSPQPTSIGIIGPVGAGKKFTAANLANHLSSRHESMHKLTYDTRLLQPTELVAACHTIRDSTATGALTVVVFENFEAALAEPRMNEFLAIMRAGSFTDRGHVHSLGAPLMFFLVNEEAPAPVSVSSPRAIASTGPNAGASINPRSVDTSILLDNLHAVARVSGPNQNGAGDKMYPIRRALMLRHLLIRRHPHLQIDGQLKVEEGVLHALLLIPTYKHGLRSLDKIISVSRLSGRRKFDVAALPPEEQIQLHVDGRVFMSYLRAPRLPPALREKLAEGLFETYKKSRVAMAKSPEERKALESERSMRDWDELPPELKESTRSQADDIPRKLRAINCFMLEEDRTDPLVRIPHFSEQDLDLLSEMEHERFNAERLQRQWRMGPRNSKERTTPFLVPWRDLAVEWRNVDRVMVEVVPSILDKAGWKIYRMRDHEDD